MSSPISRASFLTLGLCGLALAGCKGPPVPILYDGLDKPRFTRVALRTDGEKLYSAAYIDEPSTYPPGSDVTITMYSKQRVDMMINGVPFQMFPARDEFGGGTVAQFLEKYTVDSLSELGIKDTKGKPANGPGEPAAKTPPPARADVPPGADPNLIPKSDDGQSAGFRLDTMKPSTAGSVRRGLAAVGMTKEQVFMALGPPIFINFETTATNLPLTEIMKANRWVYYGSWWARAFSFGLASKRAYVFDRDGKLISVES